MYYFVLKILLFIGFSLISVTF